MFFTVKMALPTFLPGIGDSILGSRSERPHKEDMAKRSTRYTPLPPPSPHLLIFFSVPKDSHGARNENNYYRDQRISRF